MTDLEPSTPKSKKYYLELGSTPESLSLSEIFQIVKNRRWSVLLVTLLVILIFGLLAFRMPVNFKAEVVLAEANSLLKAVSANSEALVDIEVDIEKHEAIAMLTSRQFVSQYIVENKLLPVLFSKQWDAENNQWRKKGSTQRASLWRGYEKFSRQILSVSNEAETGLIHLSIKWVDPELAAKWANDLVTRVNESIRQRVIQESEKTLAYLQHEISRTKSVDLSASLNELVKVQKAKIIAANVHKEYAFRVIDPAVPPEEPAIPRLKLIMLILGTFIGLFFAVTLVLVSYLLNDSRDSYS